MKAVITTFAIAMMVFAFNATPSHAGVSYNDYECTDSRQGKVCKRISEIETPDRERDIADSGNEGSTSAASANDQ